MNEKKVDGYVEQVLENMVVEEKMKQRIKLDLYQHINEASAGTDIETVLADMGNPKDVAIEFMDTIYQDKNEVIENLVKERMVTRELLKDYYEYQTRMKFFGVPLVHVKVSKVRRLKKPCVAKGIIAIGDIAVGLIALGGIAFGLLSLGAIALGLLAIAGIAFGGAALGGIAVGLLAFGGLAIGLGAIGGVAIGNIAVGGYARGTVAIGGKAVGEYIISGGSEGPNYSLSQVKPMTCFTSNEMPC